MTQRPFLRPFTRMVAALTLTGLLVGHAVPQAHAEAAVPLDMTLCDVNSPTPLGPEMPKPWQMDRLKLDDAWRLADGTGITIAVIDTGTSNLNSAFLNASKVESLNMVPLDDNDKKQGIRCNHGTAVTSLIVGRRGADLRTSFSGIAPGARVIAYRTLKDSLNENSQPEKEDPKYAVAAINEAVKRKVNIINISQAMSGGTPEYKQAIERAIKAGITVVAAAGNKEQNLRGPAFPASYPGVISVGMTLPDDSPSPGSYANQDMQVTIGAPGEGVAALYPSMKMKNAKPNAEELAANQSYSMVSGTSFATPIVSGVVALMLQRNPKMTPAQVRERLIETADPPVATAPDPRIGYGVVNPLRALTGAAAPTSSKPESSETPAPVEIPEAKARDMRARQLVAAGALGTGILVLGGLALRLALPAAARRGFRHAEPPRKD